MKNPIRLSFAFLSLLLLSACDGGNDSTRLRVEPDKVAQMDAFIEAQMAKQHIPGLAIAVMRDGKPILEKGYGVANVTTQRAVTPSTVFRIGSVTKQFTAAAVMLLVQEGQLSLDDSIRRYLPSAPASWQAITVRHLLNHTSGLRQDFAEEDFLALYNPDKDYSIDELVSLMGQLPLDAQPGEGFVYSNFGYHLLGFIVEKASGLHYADFLRARVFEPLGMQTADTLLTTRPVPSMAAGYTWSNGALQPANDENDLIPGYVEGEGGLQMSAADLAKWDAALHSEQLLTRHSLQQMWTSGVLNNGTLTNYGFAWFLDAINGSPFIEHGGNISGYTTQFNRHLQEGLSVIVLNNLDQSASANIAARIAAIMDSRLEWKTIPDRDAAATALAEVLVSDLRSGVFNPEHFSPDVQESLPTELYSAFAAVFRDFGPTERFGLIDRQLVNGLQKYRYVVSSPLETAVLSLWLDANNKVKYLEVSQ